MLLNESEQPQRLTRLLSDPETPLDLREYLNCSSSLMVTKLEQYISKIEEGKIKIQWLKKVDLEAAKSVAQIYEYPVAVTSDLSHLIEQAIVHYNPCASWSGYAGDLAWMSIRVGIEIPYGTIVFPCEIGSTFKSFTCTFIPSGNFFVFGTLAEILSI